MIASSPRSTKGSERLDEEQLIALITRAQAGDLSARNRVVAAHWGLVHWAVERVYRGGGGRRDDLFQCGFFGLVAAIRWFDPERGAFAPWALRSIRRACGRFKLADRIVPVPPWWRSTKYGPRAMQATSVSLHEPISESNQAHLSLLVGNEPDPAVTAEERDTRRALREAVRALPLRHREIMNARLAGHSVDQIARALRVSPQRIGQLQQHAIQRLRTALQPELG